MRALAPEQILDREDLNLGELSVFGFVEASRDRSRLHRLCRRRERDEHAHLRVLVLDGGDKVLDHRVGDVLAALY